MSKGINKRSFFLVLLIIFFAGQKANSQVLISLLLGDKLNTGNIEFGLEGGMSSFGFYNVEDDVRLQDLALGFYFYFKLSEHSYLSPGVLVKSSQGAENLLVYTIGNAVIDNLFASGNLNRKIGYFQIPLTYHYRLNSGLYFEAGMQVALRYSGTDRFYTSVVTSRDLVYSIDSKKTYTTFDAGIVGGLGYKLKTKSDGLPRLSFGTKYYYGLVDVSKTDGTPLKNDTFYFYVRIPIGAKKAQQQRDNQ